jgi:lycopene cyclase CruP
MVRHLPRLSRAVDDALKQDRLTRKDLALLQPYQPSLSVSWLFQRAMHIEMGQLRDNTAAKPEALRSPQDSSLKEPKKQKGTRGWLPASHVNKLMRCNFAVMRMLGDRVLKPFVQDSMQLGPLALTMLGMMLRDPFTVTLVLFQVGPGRILDWFRHFVALAAFTALFFALRPLRTVVTSFRFQRLLDALEYGAALDYRHHAAGETASSHAARVEVSGEHNANMKVNGSSVKRRAVEQPTPLYNI